MYTENVPEMLGALKGVFSSSGAQNNHRDLASFIAYTLQESQAHASNISQRRAASSGSESGRTTPLIRKAYERVVAHRNGDPSLSKSTVQEVGIHVLEAFTQVLCDASTVVQLKRFTKQVPGRVSARSLIGHVKLISFSGCCIS